MNFSFVDNRINDIPDFDFIYSSLDNARRWVGKDVYVLTYDLSRDIGMINAKIMKGVVEDYINLTKDGNSIRIDMAVDVEGRLTIPCSIFNIFDTEEQAKHVVDIFTKMGKGIFTYKEEMPL